MIKRGRYLEFVFALRKLSRKTFIILFLLASSAETCFLFKLIRHNKRFGTS